MVNLKLISPVKCPDSRGYIGVQIQFGVKSMRTEEVTIDTQAIEGQTGLALSMTQE